ncbi:hypothetical protein QAD02_011581 [Eretmocerus hayati]|uniref:Uncharacterized protein n=1 Tax=Eretmocerus hayati TaxID=131215 RepID=A0ACC2P204_9HYME|nr:hypothetical protein QAD02_011581 [Eretmocerus hayati]
MSLENCENGSEVMDGGSVVKDLEELLKETMGDQLQVIGYAVKDLLPKGENYASLMLKIDADIKRTPDAAVEKIHLVGKTITKAEFQKSHMNATMSFSREIFIFKELLPMYRQLELEAGIPEKDAVYVGPKFYGGRLTRNKGAPDEADEDAILLLENIKVQSYDTQNRMKGLDLEHAKLAIHRLAHYHALGIAMRQEKADFYNGAQKYLTSIPFNMTKEEYDAYLENIVQTICEDPRIAKHEERIKACLQASEGWEGFFNFETVEPWVTICHGDFWVNNMMFKHDGGKATDVKFVDFQLTRVSSPLKDIPYFTCSSTSSEVLINHLDELLDTYYRSLIESIDRLGCDSSPFTRDSFEKELKRTASKDFLFCVLALKFFTLEVSKDQREDINVDEVIKSGGASNLYLDRTWYIVSKFIERGWM